MNEQSEICGEVINHSKNILESDFVKLTFNAPGWNNYIEKIKFISGYDLKEPLAQVKATKIIGMTMQQLTDCKVMVLATETGIFIKNCENLQKQIAFFEFGSKDKVTLTATLSIGHAAEQNLQNHS